MLRELDTFLSLTKRQRQVYTLLHYSGYCRSPLSIVNDQRVLDQVVPEIENWRGTAEKRGSTSMYGCSRPTSSPSPDRPLVLMLFSK